MPSQRPDRGGSEFSYNRSAPSEASYMTSKTNRSGKLRGKVEVASNPLCPRIKGLCCLMILFNLALILICLGFSLVLQFYEPGFVWYLGLFMLVFGFVTLIGSFIYCVVICQEHKAAREREEMGMYHLHREPESLYWNKQWGVSPTASEITYDNRSGRSIETPTPTPPIHKTHRLDDSGSTSKLNGKQPSQNYYGSHDRERY